MSITSIEDSFFIFSKFYVKFSKNTVLQNIYLNPIQSISMQRQTDCCEVWTRDAPGHPTKIFPSALRRRPKLHGRRSVDGRIRWVALLGRFLRENGECEAQGLRDPEPGRVAAVFSLAREVGCPDAR